MQLSELIFSNQRSMRIRRHLLFWAAWVIYFQVTFLIPTYWIPDWDLNGDMPQIKKYGVVISCLRILMNSLLMAIVHMILLYGIIYYFLPRYMNKNKSRLGTTGLLIAFLAIVCFINYFNFVVSFSITTYLGVFESFPKMDFILRYWIRQILINYPAIVGFGLTIKLLKNWYLRQKETAQLTQDKIKSELEWLKAQVHPHFFFNTLNNIYSFILNSSQHAPVLIKKFYDLLHYIIYDCNHPYVPLEGEIKMINDYMALEKVRYGENFNMHFEVTGNPAHKSIRPLFLIPFLENSFMHGASQMLTHPWVKLQIRIDEDQLSFNLSNSRPVMEDYDHVKKGIGLNNVKKRLGLLYPGRHTLVISDEVLSFSVVLNLALSGSEEIQQTVSTQQLKYELA